MIGKRFLIPQRFAVAFGLVCVVCLGIAERVAGANIQFAATLDVAQQLPVPQNTSPTAGGTATFTYVGEQSDTGALQFSYVLSEHDLTGPITQIDLHQGEPGAVGVSVLSLDPGQASGVIEVGGDNGGLGPAFWLNGMYLEIHTEANPDGEIRGQVVAGPGSCACDGFASHKQYVKCVKTEIKQLPKSYRKVAVRTLRNLKAWSAASSCGLTKQPKDAVACCTFPAPIRFQGIVTESLCLPMKERACHSVHDAKILPGESCIPNNPCQTSMFVPTTTTTSTSSTTSTIVEPSFVGAWRFRGTETTSNCPNHFASVTDRFVLQQQGSTVTGISDSSGYHFSGTASVGVQLVAQAIDGSGCTATWTADLDSMVSTTTGYLAGQFVCPPGSSGASCAARWDGMWTFE